MSKRMSRSLESELYSALLVVESSYLFIIVGKTRIPKPKNRNKHILR